MRVSTSAYYAWHKRPGQLISAHVLHLHRRMKALFKQSRESLGSREMMKKLREEGIEIGRYKVRKLMKRLNLIVTQRIAYKVTTKRDHRDDVADNMLNQNFNPTDPNQVWAGDITYLKTGEGWMYLAIVMDLFSRRIVGWHISKRMTTDLVCKAIIMAYNLRQPPKGLVFHSDRGSQYTSKRYRKLLGSYGIRASMGDVGACWDNAVVERFFGSLKHDWIFKVAQPTREHMKKDVAAYMKYYNLERLHTANGDQSPINYENSLKKCPVGLDQNNTAGRGGLCEIKQCRRDHHTHVRPKEMGAVTVWDALVHRFLLCEAICWQRPKFDGARAHPTTAGLLSCHHMQEHWLCAVTDARQCEIICAENHSEMKNCAQRE